VKKELELVSTWRDKAIEESLSMYDAISALSCLIQKLEKFKVWVLGFAQQEGKRRGRRTWILVVGEGRVPAAVLIRALRPTYGLDAMAANRGLSSVPPNLRQLASGPGRLAQALGIDRQANGLDLRTAPLWVRRSPTGRRLAAVHGVCAGPRINVDYAGQWARRPWRFMLSGDRFVSV